MAMKEPHLLPPAAAGEEWENSTAFSDELIARVQERSSPGCLLCALDQWDDE
jgi:hypothetical protein